MISLIKGLFCHSLKLRNHTKVILVTSVAKQRVEVEI